MVAGAPWAAFGGTAGARPCSSWALPRIPEEGAASLACVALSALPGERPTVLFPEPVRIPPLPLPQCGWLPSAAARSRAARTRSAQRRGRRSPAASGSTGAGQAAAGSQVPLLRGVGRGTFPSGD